MNKQNQLRWHCPFCKAEGWWTPSTHVGRPPAKDHDRPDGRKCRRCNEPLFNFPKVGSRTPTKKTRKIKKIICSQCGRGDGPLRPLNNVMIYECKCGSLMCNSCLYKHNFHCANCKSSDIKLISRKKMK